MLSITLLKGSDAAAKYYLDNPQENYYLDRERNLATWEGSGVKALKLEGRVQEDTFRNLLHGFSRDGKTSLVQNAGAEHRQCGWDLTFSAPKSVSVLWALASKRNRRLILKAHLAAVKTALAIVEKECGLTRRGQGGMSLERVSIAFGCFTHFTSRALDMALHTHCVLPNVGIRQDGTTGALFTNRLFEMKLALGRAYREQLALNLQMSLALTIEPQKVGFHIKGVPKQLCRIFSKRRNAILQEMERMGTTGGVAAKVAALSTRAKKKDVALEQLFPIWERIAASHGFGRIEAEQLINGLGNEIENQATQRKVANLPNSERPVSVSAPAPRNDHQGSKHPAQRAREQSSRVGEETAKQSHYSEQREGSSVDGKRQRRKDAASQERGDKSQNNEFKEQAKEYRTSEQTNKKQSRTKARPKSRNRAASKETEEHQAGAGKKKKGWIRLEKQLLFPNASDWNPLKYATASVVVIGDKRKFRRWGDIMWKKDLKVFQLRVQWKQMFPNSPSWSPAKFAQIPALRVLSPSQLRKAQQAKKNAARQEERLDHSH